jgi:hypothetical protein
MGPPIDPARREASPYFTSPEQQLQSQAAMAKARERGASDVGGMRRPITPLVPPAAERQFPMTRQEFAERTRQLQAKRAAEAAKARGQ